MAVIMRSTAAVAVKYSGAVPQQEGCMQSCSGNSSSPALPGRASSEVAPRRVTAAMVNSTTAARAAATARMVAPCFLAAQETACAAVPRRVLAAAAHSKTAASEGAAERRQHSEQTLRPLHHCPTPCRYRSSKRREQPRRAYRMQRRKACAITPGRESSQGGEPSKACDRAGLKAEGS